MTITNAVGVSILTVILVGAASVITALLMKRSKSANAIYFGGLIGGSVISLLVGASADAHGHSFLEGYAATMVLLGTSMQVILDASRRKKASAEKDDTEKLVSDSGQRDALSLTGWALIITAAIAVLANVFLGA